MKSLILGGVLMFVSLSVFASEKHEHKGNPFLKDDHYPSDYFLMPNSMPHFMNIYIKKGGKKILKPTKEQDEKIAAYVKKIVPDIMSRATKTKKLETKIAKAVIFDGKTAEDLSTQIDEVAKIRRELTVIHLKCLNLFKNTLDEKRYHLLVELAESSQGHDEEHEHSHDKGHKH